MKLIVGLGNPGRQYAYNRHNTGFHVIDTLAERHNVSIKKNAFKSIIGLSEISGDTVLLAKPKTFVNASGKAVAAMMDEFKVKPGDLIIVYDDLDMPLGRIRVRPNGSSGGHNGLKSIIASIGSSDFARVKIGIGRPDEGSGERASEEEIVEYVLSDFTRDEMMKMLVAFRNAAAAVETILAEGTEAAMNKFNKGSKNLEE